MMTKMIEGLRNLPCEKRLKQLNLLSLERRSVRGDMTEVDKWMKAYIHKVMLEREPGSVVQVVDNV